MKNYLFLLFSLTIIQAEWTQVDIPDNQNMVKLIPDGNGLYGATSAGSILISLDNGHNWESLPMHSDIFPYGVDLFKKVDNYLFFSQNIGGSTYNYRAYYNGAYWEDWEILPYDESIIYEFVHHDNTIYALLNQGISVSYDYGTSWELIETPEISGYIHLQYVDDQYLYINHGCNLYRYKIEMQEWTDITGILDDIGPPEPYSCTSISQIKKFNDKLIISMYWYGGVGTLFYSQNDGDSWEIISSFPSMSNSGYGHNNISAMTTKRGTLYAGTATSQDGIFYTNNLTDWTEYSMGLSSYNLLVSTLAVTDEKIYKLGGTVNLFQNTLIETGCTDPEACNYNPEATEDDGSCEYYNPEIMCDCEGSFLDLNDDCCSEFLMDECGVCNGDGPAEHHDCEGNCLVEFDCAGNCCVLGEEGCYWQETGPCGEDGPSDGMDSCGVCGGDNSSCSDCAGVPCSDAYVDNCGVCDDDPTNDCVQGCDGVWGGGAELDECGVCDGDGSSCADTDGDGCLDDIDDAPFEWDDDYDADGVPDDCDADDDNDGAADDVDSDDNNEYVCSDMDGDTCDDCSSGTFDTANDGPDMNGNGICDAGDTETDSDGDGVIDDEDSDPFNPYQCSDNDGDNCDDCTSGTVDASNDGSDYDADGQCDAGDADDDNDTVPDGDDCAPQNEFVSELDECGVCGGDNTTCQQLGDINGDGTINVIDIVMAVDLILSNDYYVVGDVNEDGQLNVIDVVILVDWVLNGMPEADSDGDGVLDDNDSDPNNPYQCSDLDSDTCDDCSTGHYDTSDDGNDYDGDGQCDAGDCDDDNDGCQECWDYCP